MTVTSLPMPIRSYVRKFVAQRRASALATAAAQGVAFAGMWLIVGGLLDRFFQLPAGLRLAMLLAGIGGIILILAPRVWSAIRLGREWIHAAEEIERVNPAFAERLRTVVSQLLERNEYRGSEQMLQQLLDEVAQTAAQGHPRRWPGLRALAPSWGLLVAVCGLFLALWRIDALSLPTLVQRQLHPMADIPPVTTTRITLLSPASPMLMRGQALVINAQIERLPGGGVDIFTSHDARSWTRIPMLPLSDTRYVFSVPAVDRDLYYRIKAGDAFTPVAKATVLRPPAVLEYRVRSEYPAYTRRGAVTASCPDGVIEALAGTQISIVLIATEPLASATLTLGGQTVLLSPTADANIWQTSLDLQKSELADLEMISTGGLRTRINGALNLRAQPDRNPIVRLVQPADDLRLHPRELLPLRYQALDDYGIAQLSLAVQINSSETVLTPLRAQGDLRRLEGQLNLDLAGLDVKVGDVVGFWLNATDGSGQKQGSDRRHILVSPRSIDIRTYERIGELKQAQALSAAVPKNLAEAASALDRARRRGIPQMEHVAERLKASRALVGAEDDAQLAYQTILRVCPRSASAQQTLALAHGADRAAQLCWKIEKLVAADAVEQKEQPLIEAVREAARTAQQLAEDIRILAEGEQAVTLLADLANLRTPPAAQPADRPAADRLRETQRRAQQDIAAAVQQLGLSPKAQDLDAQLQRKVDETERMMASRRPIDLEPAAQQWVAALRERQRIPPLVERLLAAASVQALRPDTDPAEARDLQLAARAAERLALSAPAPASTQRLQHAVGEYPAALAAIQKEHQDTRQAADAEEANAIRTAAAEARIRMAYWAGQQDVIASASAGPDDLAMQASADTVQRNYDRAMLIDDALVRRLSQGDGPPAAAESVQRTMSAIVAIDRASSQQEQLRRLIDSTASPEEAAWQQRQVAREIERIGGAQSILDTSAGSRERATAAMQLVQERLAHLPQQMAGVLEAAAAYRQAAAQEEAAARATETAQDEDQVVARVLAQQAQRALEEAEERLDRLSAGLEAKMISELIVELRSLQPETQEAVATMSDHLRPAIGVLAQSLRGTDGGAVDRAAAQVRSALQRSQWLLSEAQFRVMERDPLVAAKWFAEAASDALAQHPADVPRAQDRQQSASQALNRAWVNATRQAAGERLGLTSTYQPLLASQPLEEPDRITHPLGELLPGVRQWGFFRQRQPATIAPQLHESDFGGYQESLRLYFEAITKAQEQARK